MGTVTNSYWPDTLILNPTVINYLTISSSVTSSSLIYCASGAIGGYTISGINFNTPQMPDGKYYTTVEEEESAGIRVKFKDGGEIIIPLKEYVIFVTIHGKSPSECTKEEYEEKSLAQRI